MGKAQKRPFSGRNIVIPSAVLANRQPAQSAQRQYRPKSKSGNTPKPREKKVPRQKLVFKSFGNMRVSIKQRADGTLVPELDDPDFYKKAQRFLEVRVIPGNRDESALKSVMNGDVFDDGSRQKLKAEDKYAPLRQYIAEGRQRYRELDGVGRASPGLMKVLADIFDKGPSNAKRPDGDLMEVPRRDSIPFFQARPTRDIIPFTTSSMSAEKKPPSGPYAPEGPIRPFIGIDDVQFTRKGFDAAAELGRKIAEAFGTPRRASAFDARMLGFGKSFVPFVLPSPEEQKAQQHAADLQAVQYPGFGKAPAPMPFAGRACAACQGRGKIHAFLRTPCATCGGSGTKT